LGSTRRDVDAQLASARNRHDAVVELIQGERTGKVQALRPKWTFADAGDQRPCVTAVKTRA
jgi:hypothetical protein